MKLIFKKYFLISILVIIDAFLLFHSPKFNEDTKFYIFNLCISIVPALLSIISIAFSLSNNRIYGVKFSEFRMNRAQFHYETFDLIFISFLLLFSFDILNRVQIPYWLFIIYFVISIFYIISFFNSEIRIIGFDPYYIKDTIKKNYEFNGNKTDDVSPHYNIIWQQTDINIKHYLAVEGVNKLLEIITFNKVVEYQYKLLLDIDEELFIPDGSNETEINVNFQRNIKKCCENLVYIISLLKNDEMNKKELNSNIFYFVNSLIKLSDICEKYNLDNYYRHYLNKILDNLFEIKFKKYSSLQINVLIKLFIFSINNEKQKILEIYLERMAYYPLCFSIQFFIFILIYYYNNLSINNTDKIKNVINNLKIRSYYNDMYDSLNSFFRWRVIKCEYTNLYTLLDELIEIYDSIDMIQGRFLFVNNSFKLHNFRENVFNLEFILNCYFEFLFVEYRKYNYDQLMDKFNNIKSKYKKDVYKYYNENFIIDKVKDRKFRFISYYNENDCSFNKIYKELNNKLFEIANNFLKNKKTEKPKITVKELNLVNWFNNVCNLIHEDGYSFLSSEVVENNDYITLNNCTKSFSYIGDSSKLEEVFKVIIKKYILHDIEKILTREMPNFKQIEIDKIKNSDKYKYRTSYYCDTSTFYELNLDTMNKISGLKNIDIKTDHIVLLKENSMNFIFKPIEKDIIISRLSAGQINAMIDEKYYLYNGLYKYDARDKYPNTVYLTRDELYKNIYDDYRIYTMTYEICYKFDYDKIIVVKNTNDE